LIEKKSRRSKVGGKNYNGKFVCRVFFWRVLDEFLQPTNAIAVRINGKGRKRRKNIFEALDGEAEEGKGGQRSEKEE
jgi:hypothetical protein